MNGAEVQAHITGVGAAMAQKFDQWTAELQSVADLGSTLGNQNTTNNNNSNTANTINNNNFTTPTAPSRKRSLSDSQNNLSPINNNNSSLPANGNTHI